MGSALPKFNLPRCGLSVICDDICVNHGVTPLKNGLKQPLKRFKLDNSFGSQIPGKLPRKEKNDQQCQSLPIFNLYHDYPLKTVGIQKHHHQTHQLP